MYEIPIKVITRSKLSGGAPIPCYGTLAEIHATLLSGRLGGVGERGGIVNINGWFYIVNKTGFQSFESGTVYTPECLALQHEGTAIVYGEDTVFIRECGAGSARKYLRILTLEKTGHVSERCLICGCPLTPSEVRRQCCDGCHAAEVNA